MAQRLVQLESVVPLKKLTASFKPSACIDSSAIILIDHTRNKVCMVTKQKKIDFGGQTVFPGGLTETADGKMVNYVQQNCNPYIRKYNFLFDDLKFRINALRELFEETGILLCRNMEQSNDALLEYPMTPKMYSFDNNNERIIEWRQKVLDDPFQFEALYRSIGSVPDILCLVPWARIQSSF